jgi:uncharacterized RDD family membrane protein YckC
MAAEFAPVMKSRFQPDDTDSALGATPTPLDPEAFDVSEQEFAASLEEKSARPRSGFVLEGDDSPPGVLENELTREDTGKKAVTGAEKAAVTSVNVGQPGDPDAWRSEVAAKVNHYRGRRPRAPRYPSLQLKFESAGPPAIERPPGVNQAAVFSTGQLAITMDPEVVEMVEPEATEATDGAAKILEFPRSLFMPAVVVDELAEPVFHRPRILDVPEVLPPPPALGGILIESADQPKDDRRPGFELPLKSASLGRRILAGATDAALVVAGFAAFAYIFFRITSSVPPLRQSAGVAAALLATFWTAYQYLLLVYSETTPGLRLAKLELSRFDGTAVPRRLRRWRVLASALSGLSLTLGYIWCFMDEDELCWHDRITHTYMAPKTGKAPPTPTSH